MRRPGFLRVPEMPLLRRLVCVFTLALGATLGLVHYEKRETAVGTALPPTGIVTLTAPRAGVIKNLAYGPGDRIAANAAIARLSVSEAVDRGNAANLRLAYLDDESEIAKQEAEARRSELVARARQFAATGASLREERRLTEAQRRLSEQRLAIAEDALADAETVAANGFISRRELDGRRLTALAGRQEISGLDVRLEALNREIDEAEEGVRLSGLERDRLILEASRAAALLETRRVQEQAGNEVFITSAVPGTVAVVFRDDGSSVAAGDLIASVLPEGDAVEVRLYATAAATTHLAVGDKVRLKFDAYPFRQYGAGSGQVANISSTTLPPQELARLGLSPVGALYLVRIANVSPPTRSAGPIRSGMGVTAEIVVDRKRLIQWFWTRTLGR